jgi:putative acyl-CoA dehydrogenase
VTHEVANQPPPLAAYDAFAQDAILSECVRRGDADWIVARAQQVGALVGSERLQRLAAQANRHVPELRTHDSRGHRIDLVEYHPAYHTLMSFAFGHGLHSLAWTEPRAGRFVARAALNFLWNQGENGVACPVTMSFAAVQVLAQEPELAREWRPKLLAADYDPRPVPLAEKRAATFGMALTEKQGGSDLRAIATRAEPAGQGWFALTGHKWFCSAPMSDAFFTLARFGDGITCFLLPRSLPDGTRNRFLIQRLKDKLGNRSNASAEVEYERTLARRVGAEGRGIATLIEMAHLTRFDIVVASAGMMRAALHQALHHCAHREAFGLRLTDQPLMANVLADLALESEAATLLAFRLAQAFDRAQTSEREQRLARLLTPVVKYWLCKRTPPLVLEAMECLGGNGYVEEGPLARLYREAPVNGIWEGSGNVICLDVLRAMRRDPDSVGAAFGEIEEAARQDRRLAAFTATLAREAQDAAAPEPRARRLVERIALALQASLMIRHSTPAAADAFCASRLDGDWGRAFGTLPAAADCSAILQRAQSPI